MVNFLFIHKFMSFEEQSCLSQMVQTSEEDGEENIDERKTFGTVAGN